MSSAELEKYIASLTPSEQEEFKDLIKETREREARLEEISRKSKESIEEFGGRWSNLNKSLNDLSSRANDVKERINTLLLKLQEPDSKIYH